MELTVESVSKQYETNQVQALSDASLTLRSGAVHALVGENGAGKSTLARILVGLEPPDSGKLLLNKEELTAYSAAAARARGIRYVPQYPQFVASLTVWQNLILGEEPHRGLLLDEAGARRKLSECG
ncbi:MAG: ATP-binding cassette domain-containing protein, partial [Spirochaetaceae bacterium]